MIGKGYRLIEDNKLLKTTTYELGGLFVQIVQDVNLEQFISLSRTNNHSWKGWYDMDVIRFCIQKIPYKKDDIFKFEHLSHFFINHYDVIMKAFSPSNFVKTETELLALQDERAKVLYGF